MIRNLKVLLVAGLALSAIGAFGASSASAVHATGGIYTNLESETATTVTTNPDGAVGSTTAHQVFDVEGNGAITCDAVDLTGTVNAGVAAPAHIILSEEKETEKGFTNCKFLGQTATVSMHKCDFTFTPHGNVSIVGCEGTVITFTAAGCTVTIVPAEQTFTNIVKYANLGVPHNGTVTAEVATPLNAVKTVVHGAGCITIGNLNGTYTTGNVILSAFSHNGLKTPKKITVDLTG